MGTVRYSKWLGSVTAGEYDPANVNMNVKLVLDDYVPAESHEPADVSKYIIQGVSVLVNDFFSTHGMSDIIDEVKSKMEVAFDALPVEICSEIDRLVTDEVKREKLKELISMPDADEMQRGQLWQNLKDNGIRWFVFESAEDGILCFCEEVTL